MNKKHIEVKDFMDWLRWTGSGGRQTANRWMNQNRDMWVLFWLKFAYREREEKALEQFEIYSNSPNKSEQFDRAYNDYCRVLDKMIELLKKRKKKKKEEAAEQARNKRESEDNGKNPDMSVVGVRDLGD